MDNNIIIKENYGKSSGNDFIAKGQCKALFRGKENFENNIIDIQALLGNHLIRVFDIVLYNEIEIKNTILIEDWNNEINNYHNQPQFSVQFQKEAAIYFAKLEWENVDFMRIDVDSGTLINPKINNVFQKINNIKIFI